jgi:hypothetical protein
MQYRLPVVFEVDAPSTVPFDVEHLDREQHEQVRRSDLALLSFNDGMTRCIKDRYGAGRGRTVVTDPVDPVAPFQAGAVASAMRGSTDTLVSQ